MTNMPRALEDIRIKRRSRLKAGTYAVVLGLVYYPALYQMVMGDWLKEDYSHCSLVPFVVLYLLWEKRREIGAVDSTPSWTGLAPFTIGVFFFWLGELGGEYFTLYMPFWLSWWGSCGCTLGGKRSR